MKKKGDIFSILGTSFLHLRVGIAINAAYVIYALS